MPRAGLTPLARRGSSGRRGVVRHRRIHGSGDGGWRWAARGWTLPTTVAVGTGSPNHRAEAARRPRPVWVMAVGRRFVRPIRFRRPWQLATSVGSLRSTMIPIAAGPQTPLATSRRGFLIVGRPRQPLLGPGDGPAHLGPAWACSMGSFGTPAPCAASWCVRFSKTAPQWKQGRARPIAAAVPRLPAERRWIDPCFHRGLRLRSRGTSDDPTLVDALGNGGIVISPSGRGRCSAAGLGDRQVGTERGPRVLSGLSRDALPVIARRGGQGSREPLDVDCANSTFRPSASPLREHLCARPHPPQAATSPGGRGENAASPCRVIKCRVTWRNPARESESGRSSDWQARRRLPTCVALIIPPTHTPKEGIC